MLLKGYLEPWPLVARVVAFTALSATVGVLIYKLVEVPGRKMYDEFRGRRVVQRKRRSAHGQGDGVEVREVA